MGNPQKSAPCGRPADANHGYCENFIDCAKCKAVARPPEEKKPKKLPAPKKAEVIQMAQLPFWPDPERTSPNAMIRSALFGVSTKRGEDTYRKDKVLASWGKVKITYTGEALNQFDLDVWMTVVHLSRRQDLSAANGVHFTLRGFLKVMGRSGGGFMRQKIRESLDRLTACAVSITGQGHYSGGLVFEFGESQTGASYRVSLNPRLVELFDAGFTRIDWETRQRLKSPIAQQLHLYISSHKATKAKPHRIGLERLRSLFGSERQELRFLKRDVRKAMERLVGEQVVADWRITDGGSLEFSRPTRASRTLSAPSITH